MLNKTPWELKTREGMIVIDDLVCLSANNDIVLWDWMPFAAFVDMERWREIASIIEEHNDIIPGRLIAAIEKALPFRNHDRLKEALTGGWTRDLTGPITYDQFIEVLEGREIGQQTRRAKAYFIKVRRMEFGAIRAQLVLQMIEAGTPYRCVHPGCTVGENLTIDHKFPLSRGGSDELSNLQFMCTPHNSQKHAKVETGAE
jgi:hypothetical protein